MPHVVPGRCARAGSTIAYPLPAGRLGKADGLGRSGRRCLASGGTDSKGEEEHTATGTVTWFNSEKGLGFLSNDDGSRDVFAQYSAIASSGYRPLEENQKVRFDVVQGPKGPQADDIHPF